MMELDDDIIIIDTETTGFDFNDDKVIEIAAMKVNTEWEIVDTFEQLIDPKRDIPPESSAIHHLTARDLVDKPTMEEVYPALKEFVGNTVLVAHNAPFDSGMLPELDNNWLCSLRLARHLWPKQSHKMQSLRYWLGLIDIDLKGLAPHRALADIIVTLEVFKKMIDQYGDTPVDELMDYVNGPITVELMPFGKHRGEPLVAVPRSYKTWALNNIDDMDPDLRWSIEKTL